MWSQSLLVVRVLGDEDLLTDLQPDAATPADAVPKLLEAALEAGLVEGADIPRLAPLYRKVSCHA